ncbi:Concanavalin A-like lectin/glucanase domain [Phytophthora cactorum]|nr:Concanavalin A-like lectin/glucanase domain [Phytophthora cactorum]
MQLEELPVDLVEAICGYLAGFDAFQLSHTNSWWFALLSDGLVWHERMVHGPVPGSQQHLLHTWKRRYMQARSMLFHGLGTDDKDELLRASYACVEYPPPTDWGQFRRMYFALRTMHEESFSFDLYTGGVIFGLQSEERDSRNWPQYHQQFVMVDSKSNLYCSVLDVKRPVAKDLKCDHWYHLVLTYDLEHQKQDVYLDGDNVWSTTGALHREWQHLLHEQFRFYSGVLPLEEVQHLAQGGDLPPKRLSGTLKYPGLRGPQSRINVELVACTRPAEGRPVEIVAVDRKASFPHKSGVAHLGRCSREAAWKRDVSAFRYQV